MGAVGTWGEQSESEEESENTLSLTVLEKGTAVAERRMVSTSAGEAFQLLV